jgi:hypothetical protein
MYHAASRWQKEGPLHFLASSLVTWRRIILEELIKSNLSPGETRRPCIFIPPNPNSTFLV